MKRHKYLKISALLAAITVFSYAQQRFIGAGALLIGLIASTFYAATGIYETRRVNPSNVDGCGV